MASYDSVTAMMNTKENMEHLVINTRHDDDVMQFVGADWFSFNGTPISNIFVSGNSFIGLGTNAEHLLVCRRDAAMYDFYREEGSLFGAYRFLKIRWEGYAQYNNISEDVRLVYEWVFFETGDMFLNIIKAPNAAGYLGTNRINGGMNADFTIVVTQQQYISFYHKDDNGKQFDIEYSVINILPPFERKYLLSDKEGKFYRLMHNKAISELEYEDESLAFDESSYLEEVPISRLSADSFREYGFDDFPRNIIFSQLVDPTLYYWQDSDAELLSISAKLKAVPPVQLVYSKNTEMNDSTILGIESVEIDSDEDTLFAFSFNGGSIWKAYIDGRWVVLSEETSGMNRESVKTIGTDAWNEAVTDRQYKIRFALYEGGFVNRITVHYLN